MFKAFDWRHAGARSAIAAAAAVVLVMTTACGDKKKDGEEKKATQAAARVNKEELTINQINLLLGQQRGLKPEQAEEAGKQALERLIDQELALQKAAEQKLDRDPRVMQQLEAARRDIVARAYFEKVGGGAPKASDEEIKKYYAENPALFAERRIFQLQEIVFAAPAEQVAALRAKAGTAKNAAEFVQALRAADIKFTANQAVRAAEQLPMAALPQMAKMKEGDALFTPTPTGAQVVFVAGVRSQPVDEARARPAIEQFLLNERKRKLIADDLKALRAQADIKYLGKYAEGAPQAAPIAPAPTPAQVAASAAKALDEASIKSGFGLKDDAAAGARPSAPIAEPAAPSASSIDASTINKGLGLK